MTHFPDHAQDLWSRFVLDRIVQFLNSEGLHSGLLTLWAVDRTAHLGDFDFSHDLMRLTVKYFLTRNSSQVSNILRTAQLLQRIERCFHYVVWIA